ncbi:hypothetical protein AC1031_019161 [Aphanomyces cochlioides]|nr:hypothetical protein AC1031_019161 [Aphanomyces cochlioides]
MKREVSSPGDHEASRTYSLVQDVEHPFAQAGWISHVSFGWISPLLRLGAKQPLMEHDVWDLPYSQTCAGFSDRFALAWATVRGSRLVPRFNVALVKCFLGEHLACLGSQVIATLSLVVQPLVIQSFLQYLQGEPISIGISNGYALMALLVAATSLQTIFLNYAFFIEAKIGVNMRSVTMDMVYQKALKLSSSARQLTTSGEIVTLMSSDSERICEAATDGLWIIVSPFTLLCAVALVGAYFGGWAALSAFGATAFVLIVSAWLAIAIGSTRLQVTAVTEERVRLTTEILQGIRVMKFYAWEPAISHRLTLLRQKETRFLRRLNLLRVVNVEFLFLAPVFVGAAVLSTYIALGNAIDSTQIFTLIAFVNMSRIGAGRRLDIFFDLEEQSAPVFSNNVPGTVRLVHATLAWQSTPPTCLSNLNLTIAPGSLVMVVGSVGAGKSSLISAVLGEMHLVQGSVDVDGSLALVSQEPWIRNDTVRGNILFEDPYDASWYKTVLQAVQLEADMRLLPAGDKTEIGEQGINLSGGQKARVNLARALYKRESNVLLLDDPLSAVDVHVAKAIFDQAIEGLARGKTRIMVMNSHYQFLQHADRIVVMENGSIVGDGTFAELYTAFPQFLNRPSDKKSTEENFLDENAPKAHAMMEAPHRTSEVSAVEDDAAVLIIEEDRAKGIVSKKTYFDYFGHVGFNGWVVSSSLVFMFAFGQTMRVAVDWWQGYWAARYYSVSVATYHGVFYGFVIATILFFAGRCALLATYTSRCSENMHNQLLRCVLRAPINLFFDVTPVGRILNRFSRDLDIVDSLLPNLFLDILQTFFIAASSMIVCAVSSIYVALSYLPVIGLFYLMGEFFKKSSRELKRLEGVSRSPIFSSFAETLDGVQTIRAFKMDRHFIRQNRKAVDTNAKYLFALVGAGRWFSVRTYLVSVFLIAIMLTVIINIRHSISATTAGLALTYSLALLPMVQWFIRLYDMVESAMTAVERLLHFKTIPKKPQRRL